MVSNQWQKTAAQIALGTCFLFAMGCSITTGIPDFRDENNIGESVDGIAGFVGDENPNSVQVSIFDETTRKIHLFDVSSMSRRQTYSVSNPEAKHYLLSHPDGNYVIDISLRNVTVIDRSGRSQAGVIQLIGKPRSVALDPVQGYLVVYDDMANVGIAKINPMGVVEDNWVGGGYLSGSTISAGDLDENGNLIMAMSDGQVVTVDLAQSLAQRTWVFTAFAGTVPAVNWLAPIKGTTQILVRSSVKVAIIDTNTHAVLSEQDVEGKTTEKLSKLGRPHVITRSGNDISILSVTSGALTSRTLYRHPQRLLSYRLSSYSDEWTFVDTEDVYSKEPKFNDGKTTIRISLFNDSDQVRVERTLRRYRYSDMLAMRHFAIPAQAQIRLAPQFVFALFPSELGYAARYSVTDESKSEIRAFNMGHF